MELHVRSKQNSTSFCWQIAFPYPMSLCLAPSKGCPNYFNGWLTVWPEFPYRSFMVMAIWGLCKIRPHVLMIQLSFWVWAACGLLKCKIYWGQVLYLFLFSVVSSFSGWGCFSCCCGRNLTLFFSAAIEWVLSILLKIIKQHAIEIFLKFEIFFRLIWKEKPADFKFSNVYVTGKLILNFLCILTLFIHALGLGDNGNWEST